MLVTLDDNEIYYELHGQKTDKDDIVILHGWGCNTAVYKSIVQTLSVNNRVIVFDFPGFGKSSAQKKPWDVDDFVNCTAKLLEYLQIENPILIGHSNGGRVIIRLCYSGLLIPKKIVMLDAAGVRTAPKFKQKIRATTFKTIKVVLNSPPLKNHSKSLMAKARNHFGSADYNSANDIMKKTIVNLVNLDQTEELSSIKASTLLIYGENDTATPLAHAKIMNKHIKDSGLCVIKNAGHFSFLDKPAEVGAILKSFLP